MTTAHRWRGVFAGCFVLLAACSSGPASGSQDLDAAADTVLASGPESGTPDALPDRAAPPDAPIARDAAVDVVAPAEDAAADAGPIEYLRDPPALPTYGGGTCPTLTMGPTSDTSLNAAFRSAGETRQFRVLVPRNYDPSGTDRWPLVFAFHWLNASGNSFIRDGELERAAELMRIIFVLPENLERNGNKAYLFDWPFAEEWGIPGELQFLRDMLACTTQQLRIDPRRIHAMGASAGALWVVKFMETEYANWFASVVSISGGLGSVDVPSLGPAWSIQFVPQFNRYPAVVVWGGTSDWLGLDFNTASIRYRDALLADRHFTVQCIHDRGHGLPPFTPIPSTDIKFRSLYQFFLDHPFGLYPGRSPYFPGGLPTNWPSFCSIAIRR